MIAKVPNNKDLLSSPDKYKSTQKVEPHLTSPSSCEWQKLDNKGYFYKHIHLEEKKSNSNVLFTWIITGYTFLWKY